MPLCIGIFWEVLTVPENYPRRCLERFLVWLTPLKKDPPGLVEAVNDAKRAWKQALDYLNHIDSNFVDYAVHNINAAERRYIALIKQARKEEIAAWPETLNAPVVPSGESGEIGEHTGPKEAVNL